VLAGGLLYEPRRPLRRVLHLRTRRRGNAGGAVVNNYPPMSNADLERLDGGTEHWRECPAHEDRTGDEADCECDEITRAIKEQRWDG